VAGRVSFPDIYFARPVDNSRLCREMDRRQQRQIFILFSVIVVPFLFLLLLTLAHFRSVRYGYQIEQLKAERLALEEWNRQLRLERAALADPQRIDRLARTGLGMAEPAVGQVIRLGPPVGGSSGTVQLARNVAAWLDVPREQ